MKVLKFGADWCSGCLIMKPIWNEIEEEIPWLKTEYYDYDKNNEIAEKYKVTDVLPTFIFLDKEGKEILRLTGELPKEAIIDVIEDNKEK